MRVLHCVADIRKQSGGQSFAITALCGAIARLGHDVSLLAGSYGTAEELVQVPDGVRLVLQPASRRFKGRSPAMKSWLAANVDNADVVHSHGLWNRTSQYAIKAAIRRTKPCVLAPIGMLEPQALRRRWLMKKAYWSVLERPTLSKASCFQATSAFEVGNIRRHFLQTPICFVPNGVDVPCERQPALPRDNYVLFLGRVHPYKNVTLLIDAWASSVRPPGWRLVIAGPLDGAYGKMVQRMAAADGNRVDVVGPVWGDQKWELIRRARALVLPSKSENFGMVVAEALSCETPVIATQGAPWAELEERNCGWWIETRRESLTRALESAMSLSDQKLALMGRNGRRLVEERYTWDRIGAQMVEVYQWLLGHGNQPACVVL